MELEQGSVDKLMDMILNYYKIRTDIEALPEGAPLSNTILDEISELQKQDSQLQVEIANKEGK
jgi:hypothetical protein